MRDLLKTVVLPKEIKDAILTGLFKRLSPVLNIMFICSGVRVFAMHEQKKIVKTIYSDNTFIILNNT